MAGHPPPVDPSTLTGGIDAYRGDNVIACSVVFIIACTAFLILRFLAHRISRNPLALEDWLVLPSWALMMVLCGGAIYGVKQGGVGRHQAWVLEHEPEAMSAWAKSLFIAQFFYGLLIPLAKSSILLLYLRLFSIHAWFRYTTYGLLAYVWLWGISEALVSIFQCHPVAYQWDKKLNGTCIDQLSYYRWVSLPNVIHDVVMLVLPLPVVWNLHTDARRKIALTVVFLIGSIGCVASFIRLANFFVLDALSDNTWASVQLMSWNLAEPGVIIICGCAPSLWPLIRLSIRKPGSQTLSQSQSQSQSLSRHSRHHTTRANDDDGEARITPWDNYQATRCSQSDEIPLKEYHEQPQDARGARAHETV